MQLFGYRKIIAENLMLYIRLNGYTKTSFSRLANISPLEMNQILLEDSPSPLIYEKLILKITESLNLQIDYFLKPTSISIEKWQLPTTHHVENRGNNNRSELVKALLEDLEELLEISSLYIKKEFKS